MGSDMNKSEFDQVSCQVLGIIFAVADEKQIETDWLLENVPFDRAYITKPTNYIDWSSFVDIVGRIASRLGSEEILALSEASHRYPTFKIWLLIGRLRFDLFGCYNYILGAGGVLDRLYPIKVETLKSIPALGRLSFRFSVPDHLEPCEPLFRVFEGQAIGMSQAFGFGPSDVKAHYGARQVEFEILLPAETGLFSRLRRVITFPFSWGLNLRALGETQDTLLELQQELLEETRQLKEEQKRSERIQSQLDIVLNNQKVMLWTLDMELRSTYMSSSVEKFVGYTVEEMKNLPPFATMTKESKESALEMFRESFEREASGERFYGTDALRLLQVRKDGSTFWSENYLSFLRNADQEPIGIMGFSVDITDIIDREAREESLHQQLQSLRQREFVSQLVGGIAHDFNNFLQSITGFAELALGEVENSPAKLKVAELQHHILRSASGAADLTKKLLALSREQPLNRKPINIDEWLMECLPMARSVLGKNVELIVDELVSVQVFIDSLQMERALLNLLINAKDAMGGTGTITIQNTLHEVGTLAFAASDGGLDPHAQYLEISILDTGSGIPESDLKRIFEPFFSSKTSDKGTGLGLAITAGIIDQHQGIIRAQNLLDGGASLHIFLPLHQTNGSSLQESEQRFSCQGLKILLADDEDMVRELCRSFLEADGAIVTEANSGQAALDLASTQSFDLIVMDVVMPELSGHEAARIIRQSQADQPFLFITGYAGSRDALDELTQDHVLAKPFRRAELLKAISQVMTA